MTVTRIFPLFRRGPLCRVLLSGTAMIGILFPFTAQAAESAATESVIAFSLAALGGGILSAGATWLIARNARKKARSPLPAPAAVPPTHRLLESLARIQGHYVHRQGEAVGFEALLQDMLTLTDSAYGVLHHCTINNGTIETKRIAVAWNSALSERDMSEARLPNLDVPMRDALKSRRPLLGRALVQQHDAYYCAVPLILDDTVVGVLALANRAGGYNDDLIVHWAPVLRATAQTLYSLHQRSAHDETQSAILLAAEQQHLILESTTDGILILDEDLTVNWMNRAVETLFGYTPGELIGTNGGVLFTPKERDQSNGWGATAIGSGASRFLGSDAETEAIHRSGRRFPITLAITPIVSDDDTSFVATIHDISRQKRDSEALARSEREVRAILDNMADTFYRTDLDGRLVMVSRSVTDLVGYSQQEMLGTRLADLYEFPDDRQLLLNSMKANQGRVSDFRASLIGKDGQRVWVSTNARYWQDPDGNVTGIEGTTRNITQWLTAEQALKENEQQFRAIADYTFEWENWIGPDGSVIWVSPGVERVVGYRPEDCLAMEDYPLCLVHTDDKQMFSSGLTRPQGDALELRFLHKDGTEVWGAMSWQAIADQSGTSLGVRTSVRDITDAKRLETHLTQHSKLATLGETAAGLVHELSQPLNIIRLAAEGSLLKMESSTLDEREQHHQFALIEGQAGRMGEIIDHIRVFSRKDPVPVEYFNPLDALAAPLDVLTDQFRADGITLVRDFPDTPCAVSGRQVQLEQVIMNLLTNARDSIVERREKTSKTGPDGLISVRASLDTASSHLNISVTDNGTGFPQDQIDRVFEPFFTTKGVGLGTGLGLSVSFGIIVSFAGTIQASNTDEGARVDIMLPYEPGIVHAAVAPERPVSNVLMSPVGRPWHALVVDDEQESAFAIATFIEGLGLRVSISHDGEEAIEIFDADPADILITDIRMPKCDGHTLIKHLRASTPDLPVIAVTGHFDDPRSSDGIRQSNPDTVLRKPVSLRALRAVLDELLVSKGQQTT